MDTPECAWGVLDWNTIGSCSEHSHYQFHTAYHIILDVCRSAAMHGHAMLLSIPLGWGLNCATVVV